VWGFQEWLATFYHSGRSGYSRLALNASSRVATEDLIVPQCCLVRRDKRDFFSADLSVESKKNSKSSQFTGVGRTNTCASVAVQSVLITSCCSTGGKEIKFRCRPDCYLLPDMKSRRFSGYKSQLATVREVKNSSTTN